ncbi:MAG TPA: DUF3090 family protein [Candidatus Saccharimonadales bacterium]|nr:DUF3090 family protein [Candidatus Saccharimonadales bacterium]
MPRHFTFDAPDRFLAAAIGEPGHREFYLQAARGRNVVTVAIEKAQVAALAERLGDLLEEVAERGVELPVGVEPIDGNGLQQPIVEAFRVGAMTLGWDGERASVLIEARSLMAEEVESALSARAAEAEDEGDDEPASSESADVLEVHLSPTAVRGFVAQAVRVIEAGRPPCPLCGLPLNPEGHICPRRNGYMH